MKPPCELIVNEILPAIRSITAKKLIEDYGFSQKKVADLMGLTQPAVSQYKRNLRGYKVEVLTKNPDVLKTLNIMIERIATGISMEEQILQFRDICKMLYKSGVICEMHKREEPGLEKCKICTGCGWLI